MVAAMSASERPRDPQQVGIEFPEGRRLRSTRDLRPGGGGPRAFAFFVAGILLGAAALGAGYWLSGGGGGASTPPATQEVTVEIKNFAFVPSTSDTGTANEPSA